MKTKARIDPFGFFNEIIGFNLIEKRLPARLNYTIFAALRIYK